MVIFKQINSKYNIKNKYNALIHIVMVLVILPLNYIIFQDSDLFLEYFEGFSFLFIYIIAIIFQVNSNFSNKKNIIGECEFDIHRIVFQDNYDKIIINIEEVESIKLLHYFIEDNSIFKKVKKINYLFLVEIKTKTNMTFELKFLAESTKQINNFCEIWKEYYKNGIQIREYFGDDKFKTILFKSINYTYKEMQDLKKELNVNSFY